MKRTYGAPIPRGGAFGSCITGAQLAAARRAAGLTQLQLASRSNVSIQCVSYWERKSSGHLDRLATDRFFAVLESRGITKDMARAFKAFVTTMPDQCGAKTRGGSPCALRPVPGKRRCRLHGGLSTGPKTPEGIERIRQARRASRKDPMHA